jgi:Na+(H+)/acetate symporter ActP
VLRINTVDVNCNGFQDWNEFQIQAELVVLAKPKMAGLPYLIAGLVAALSTGKASRAFGRVQLQQAFVDRQTCR